MLNISVSKYGRSKQGYVIISNMYNYMMVAEYHQNTLEQQIADIYMIAMFEFYGILLKPCLLQPCFHAAGFHFLKFAWRSRRRLNTLY